MYDAIQRVSSRGAVKFGKAHLCEEVRRRLGKRRSTAKAPFTILLVGGSVSLFIVSVGQASMGLVSFAVLVALTLGAWWRQRRYHVCPVLGAHSFEFLLARYGQVHGVPAQLIEPRSASPSRAEQRQAAPELDAMRAELAHYSFDRAVICDHPATVDVLLANQFHFENNCAVLGVDHYPPDNFELVRQMLRNNPRLLVVALHDASVDGCRLAHRLRNDAEWFRGQGTVVDVGLRPAHAKFFPGMHHPVEHAAPVRHGGGVSPEEAEWLQSAMLPLAVVPPEQIVKRLFRAITGLEANPGAHGASGDGGGSDGTVIYFGSHAEASDGGADSFG
jgi:hypothetical protein